VKFVADECYDAKLVSSLRSNGHEVVYVKEFRPGALDKEVLEKALLKREY
jgi:hypothetical protein